MYRGFYNKHAEKTHYEKMRWKKEKCLVLFESERVFIMHYIMALLTSLDPNLSIENTHSTIIIESESRFFLSIAKAALNLY